MGSFIGLFIIIALIALGFVVGGIRERHHVADLDRREAIAASIMMTDLKTAPPGVEVSGGQLVMGEVVIASDYFKSFAGWLRSLVGGELKTFQTMLSRARREARLRMLEEANALGATMAINVRFEWSTVGPRLPSAEIFCYGAAIIPRQMT